MRIGFGYDAHQFGQSLPDHRIVLGGVPVPYEREVLAHSDGDVIIHALCDALLGALAAGDIGKHFPDTDPKWQGADSRLLLRSCMDMVAAAGFVLGNADMTLIAERPKVRDYIDEMRAVIAEDMNADVSKVSVKATTTEQMGFIGREEGLAAQAAVLLSLRQ